MQAGSGQALELTASSRTAQRGDKNVLRSESGSNADERKSVSRKLLQACLKANVQARSQLAHVHLDTGSMIADSTATPQADSVGRENVV